MLLGKEKDFGQIKILKACKSIIWDKKNGLILYSNLVLLQLKPFALETFLPFTFFLNLNQCTLFSLDLPSKWKIAKSTSTNEQVWKTIIWHGKKKWRICIAHSLKPRSPTYPTCDAIFWVARIFDICVGLSTFSSYSQNIDRLSPCASMQFHNRASPFFYLFL